MEIQLQELINQIKKDGVNAAEIESKSIVDSAKEQAEKIIADAQKQADAILLNAKSETERMEKSSEENIRQAGRNLLISFRESVARELDAIITKEVTDVYSSDKVAQLIMTVIEKSASNPDAEDIAVILNDKDLKTLEKTLLAGIKEKMLSGITLKASDNFEGGFRIATDNGRAYYDYSADAVINMLSNYLNPKVTQLLKEAK